MPSHPSPEVALKRTVGAMLPRRLLSHVRHSLGKDVEVLEAGSWGSLEQMIKRHALRAVILDPAIEGQMDSRSVMSLLRRYPSLPIIAYVTLGPATFSGIAHLSRLGLEHVMLHRFDDSPERFRRTIESVGSDPLVRRVLGRMRRSMEALPVPLAMAIQNMFEWPQHFLTALNLKAVSGLSLNLMYRSCREANLASPKSLLIAARALRAYSYLQNPGYSVRDTALKLGYFHPRTLGSHMEQVFGAKPLRVRRRIAEREALSRVLAFVHAVEQPAP